MRSNQLFSGRYYCGSSLIFSQLVLETIATELFVWLAPAIDDLQSRYLVGLIYDINKTRNIIASFYLATSLWVSGIIANRHLYEKFIIIISLLLSGCNRLDNHQPLRTNFLCQSQFY